MREDTREQSEVLSEPARTGEAHSAPAAAPQRAALAFIFVTVALDMLALGMIAPVLPTLIQGFLGGNAARTAEMLGVFGTVWAAMQFGCSPVLGSMSDRFGRRPIVLISNFGTGLDYMVMALAPSLPWLFAGRVVSGITTASIPTAMAYIADVTPPEKRAGGFGMISAAFGLGFVLGPAVGGLLGDVNPRLPFWVAGALSILNGLYGLLVLPESLAAAHRGRFSWKRANPVGSMVLLRSNSSLLGLSATLLLGYLAHQVLTSTYVIYADYRYGWNDRTVGLSLALVGAFSALVGAVLVKPAVKRFGESTTMLMGISAGTLGFAATGLAAKGYLFWAAIPIMNLWGLAGPTAQGMMTRAVQPSEQGQLQGALNGIRGITGLMGPALFTLVFAKAIEHSGRGYLVGAPFLLAALLLLISLMLG